MTTTVKIDAHHTTTKQVEIKITDGETVLQTMVLQDGESTQCVVYDGRVLTVREVDK